jgi:hypothetical protein
MSTHDGFYRQVDGLAMGSSPAPLLANGWLHKFDPIIRDDAKLFARYMDDVVRSIRNQAIADKLKEINTLHEKLKFTHEPEIEQKLPVLDLMLIIKDGRISSMWYQKPTDTGLIMNYHLAPKHYKRSVVSGFIHRIYRACSNWELIHKSLEWACELLERNWYPLQFYEPIFRRALMKIISAEDEEDKAKEVSGGADEEDTNIPKKLIYLQYREKVTENFCRDLQKVNASARPVLILRKLKAAL